MKNSCDCKIELLDEIHYIISSFYCIGYINFVEFFFELLHRNDDDEYYIQYY